MRQVSADTAQGEEVEVVESEYGANEFLLDSLKDRPLGYHCPDDSSSGRPENDSVAGRNSNKVVTNWSQDGQEAVRSAKEGSLKPAAGKGLGWCAWQDSNLRHAV
jgi:hypothetical protein